MIDLRHKMDIEPEEIGHFACGVNFCLVSVFRLAEHGGCIEPGAERTADEIGRFEKYRGPLVPGERLPPGANGQGRVDRLVNMVSSALVVVSKGMTVIMRRAHADQLAGPNLFSPNEHGHFNLFRPEISDSGL
jgi:hypothetical protein